MRKSNSFSVVGFAVIYLLMLVSSCSEDQMELVETTGVPPQVDNQTLSGEERAIKAFEVFIDDLDDKVSTRAAKSAKVSEVKKKTTDAYRGTSYVTRALGTAMPVYELTLQNGDETNGFAVVAESAPKLCEVMAYAPIGAISDTTYNKGLATFFRDLVTVSDVMIEEAQKEQSTLATRGDIWQPYPIDASFFRIRGTEEFVRYLTQYEMNNDAPGFPYAVVDYAVTTGEVIPALWNQTAPYNNDVECYVTGTNEKVRVGCVPVACGQLMSYYKKPSSYDWELLTATPIINNNTRAATEVARLLYYMHEEGGVVCVPDKNQSAGSKAGVRQILFNMGYNYATTRDFGVDTYACLDSIYNNVKYNHPVLVVGDNNARLQKDFEAHIWVIDAMITQEWWHYYAVKVHSNYPPYEHHDVMRERCRWQFCHCNWGWGGHSNGWYYMFTPEFTDGKRYDFKTRKDIITQIRPL